MKKLIVVSLAIIAVSTSAALAKKPKAPAAAAPTSSSMGMLKASDADMAMYKKNMHDSGMKK